MAWDKQNKKPTCGWEQKKKKRSFSLAKRNTRKFWVFLYNEIFFFFFWVLKVETTKCCSIPHEDLKSIWINSLRCDISCWCNTIKIIEILTQLDWEAGILLSLKRFNKPSQLAKPKIGTTNIFPSPFPLLPGLIDFLLHYTYKLFVYQIKLSYLLI